MPKAVLFIAVAFVTLACVNPAAAPTPTPWPTLAPTATPEGHTWEVGQVHEFCVQVLARSVTDLQASTILRLDPEKITDPKAKEIYDYLRNLHESYVLDSANLEGIHTGCFEWLFPPEYFRQTN